MRIVWHVRSAGALVGLLGLVLAACGGSDDKETSATPNILLVIMDDVGIDQMQVFGYGGETPPSMPNIDQLAHEGVRFGNTWAMPACSTSRAVIFEGRFPLRTNVLGALGPNDLANSMVSPYEMTTPKLLAQRGYDSALFGKFHLALQAHNAAQYAMPHDLGWNYFFGWLDDTGDPPSIDTTPEASRLSVRGRAASCAAHQPVEPIPARVTRPMVRAQSCRMPVRSHPAGPAATRAASSIPARGARRRRPTI